MINCRDVPKIWINPTVFVKIFSVFWEPLTNLTPQDIKRANLSEVLRSVHNS